ncbi:MAG: glycosyltransferase family 2 protein, partial [Clostridia bacterium]|nr:glycosyltransferase family 2 protein [Clostridia bacterium]
MSKKLSVILPAYNEEDNIKMAADTISAILENENIEYELIFVNDGSKDNTWKNILEASERNKSVTGISFSRNFGKEAAIFAGLFESCGDCCAVIDCDLQHPPEKLVEMYRLWEDGAEVIEGVKSSRGKESFAHSMAAKSFYKIISRAVKIDLSEASDFKLLDRKAVNVLLNIRESNAFFRALSSWIGFKTAKVEFDVLERTHGETKWSAKALVKYAIRNITSFSSFPLKLITYLGVLVLFVSIVLGGITLYQKAIGTSLGGFTTVIVAILFIGSMIMISLGIIGYYISQI